MKTRVYAWRSNDRTERRQVHFGGKTSLVEFTPISDEMGNRVVVRTENQPPLLIIPAVDLSHFRCYTVDDYNRFVTIGYKQSFTVVSAWDPATCFARGVTCFWESKGLKAANIIKGQKHAVDNQGVVARSLGARSF